MRNFWSTSNIDGRKTRLEGGPQSKTGGMNTVFYMRDNGCSVVACKVSCYERNGELFVEVLDNHDRKVYETTCKR